MGEKVCSCSGALLQVEASRICICNSTGRNEIWDILHELQCIQLVKIFCMLIKYFPILYSDLCYKYYYLFIAPFIFLLGYFGIS